MKPLKLWVVVVMKHFWVVLVVIWPFEAPENWAEWTAAKGAIIVPTAHVLWCRAMDAGVLGPGERDPEECALVALYFGKKKNAKDETRCVSAFKGEGGVVIPN